MRTIDARIKLKSDETSPVEARMQQTAIQIATKPPRTTTLLCRATKPEITAPRPRSAAKLNALEPMTTPAPMERWCWEIAVIEDVISGASAARAATTPRSASESPNRSPTRSRRVTSSQLVERLTAAPRKKARYARATNVSFFHRYLADQASRLSETNANRSQSTEPEVCVEPFNH